MNFSSIHTSVHLMISCNKIIVHQKHFFYHSYQCLYKKLFISLLEVKVQENQKLDANVALFQKKVTEQSCLLLHDKSNDLFQ